MNTNPLPEFNNTNAILSGTYEAIFLGCDVIERPTFDGSPGLETVIKLHFEVPAEGVTITKFDNLRFSQKSNFRKDLRQMGGPDYRNEVFNNRVALWEHIQSLIGRLYSIKCEPSESGAFTRVTDIAAGKKTPPKGRKLALVEDGIPF
jgi:hypothetical protein